MGLKKGVSIIIFVLAILFMSKQYLFAGEISNSDEIIMEISNNISEEYITCSAFYLISSKGFKRSADLETALKYEDYSISAIQFALISSKKDRTQEMAEKDTLSQLDIKVKSMLKDIDNDISNISILTNKYLDHCKEIMEDPNKIVAEWTDKILKRHNLN